MFVEKKDHTGTCQAMWKQIISPVCHILATSVARRPGQGTASDSTMKRITAIWVMFEIIFFDKKKSANYHSHSGEYTEYTEYTECEIFQLPEPEWWMGCPRQAWPHKYNQQRGLLRPVFVFVLYYVRVRLNIEFTNTNTEVGLWE